MKTNIKEPTPYETFFEIRYKEGGTLKGNLLNTTKTYREACAKAQFYSDFGYEKVVIVKCDHTIISTYELTSPKKGAQK